MGSSVPKRHSGTLRSLFRRGGLFLFEVHSIMRIMSAFEQQKEKRQVLSLIYFVLSEDL